MSENVIDYRHELYKRFALDEHEIREGSTSGQGKVQWFVYVQREPIQARLDELFFMQWHLTYNNCHIDKSYVAVSCAITINGITREYSGGQALNGKSAVDEDTIKGAYTDAFKRAASMWGMGLYLHNTPSIWTDGYEKKDWAMQRQRKDEAWAKFTAWYSGKAAPERAASPKNRVSDKHASIPSQPAQNTPKNTDDGATDYEAQALNWFAANGVSIVEVMRRLNIKKGALPPANDKDGWRKILSDYAALVKAAANS